MEDTQILHLYWMRSTDAISESDKKYGNYCFTVSRRIVDTHEDAEECVNDTWLRAWNAIPPERPTHLRLFFAAITRNLSLDKVKANLSAKRGGKTLTVALEELYECTSGSPEVEDAAIAEELAQSVGRFLEKQKEPGRSLFLRRYFFMESIEEIAQRSGMKNGTVSVSLHRIRKALREHLKKEGFFDE